jgi:hypothetical protein
MKGILFKHQHNIKVIMAEQEKKPGKGDGRKKKFYGRFAKRGMVGRSTYKSKVQGLENNTFNVGASSNPAKFSKLLKNTRTTSKRLTRIQMIW